MINITTNTTREVWEPLLFTYPWELVTYCERKICECTIYDWQGVAYALMGLLAVMLFLSVLDWFKRRALRRRVRELEDELERTIQKRHSEETEKPDA